MVSRGRHDDRINWKKEVSLNKGNFIQLVRFWAETDSILAKHLAESPKNARYTSKGIQNELRGVVGKEFILTFIVEVQEVKQYSIIADEVTDVANKEELSLVLRNNEVKEVFNDFTEVERITGAMLAESILDRLRISVVIAMTGLPTCLVLVPAAKLLFSNLPILESATRW